MHNILKYPPQFDLDRFQPRPTLLVGPTVQLEPLNPTHVEELSLVAKEDTFFHLMYDGPTYFQWGLPTLVQNLIAAQEEGTVLPFAVIHLPSKLAIGITRYLHIQPKHRRLEIATWFASDFHGTGVNTESKYLLLQHAFETLKYLRVDFKIDKRNTNSVRAVERIKAVFEGEIKKDCVLPDQWQRTSMQFRICDDEWEGGIKSHILSLMDSYTKSAEEQKAVSDRIAKLYVFAEEVLKKRSEELDKLRTKIDAAIVANHGQLAPQSPENA